MSSPPENASAPTDSRWSVSEGASPVDPCKPLVRPNLCSSHSVVNQEKRFVCVRALRCNRWACPECFKLRRRRLIAQCMAGGANRIVTLTHVFNPSKTADQCARDLVAAWRSFVNERKRRFPKNRLSYLAVFEQTRRGVPHLHILVRGTWVSQRQLSAWMLRRIGSPIVYVQKVQDDRGAARYVAKYLSKAPERYDGCKRYWSTLDWLLPSRWRRTPRGSSPWVLWREPIHSVLAWFFSDIVAWEPSEDGHSFRALLTPG